MKVNTMNNTRSIALLLAGGLSLPAAAAELPQSAVLHFTSSYKIPAVMTFKRSGNQYQVAANINIPLFKIRFESAGVIEGKLLKPRYYRETRNGKLYSEAKFTGETVYYGKVGDKKTDTLSGVTMDLFTLAWQLAASDAELPDNIHITNGKKIYPVGQLTQIGTAPYKFSGGTTEITRYRVQHDDNTISYAFAPKFNNIPMQIGYLADDGKTYTLRLSKLTVDGKAVKP